MKIIFSAYFCNPFEVSEAYGAFEWLRILLEKYHVIVFTSPASEKGLRDYYHHNLPSNLEIYSFEDDNVLRRKLNIQFHFGYFTFNKNLKKFITSGRHDFKDVKAVLHKNPSSFRYFTYLYKLKIPLVLGPLGGGLQVPDVLKSYFRSESRVNKLRKYDKWLFRLPVYKALYKKADKILISFDYIRETLPAAYHAKAVAFFDTGILVDNDFPRRRPAENGLVRILYVGKLIRYKGAELAIRAMATLKEENIHFDILGSGVEHEYLRRLTDTLGLSHRVTLHGNVSREKVDEFYQRADIFCFPTLTEAGGTVFLEAMKFGLPIVTVNNGGPKFLCPDAGTFKVPVAPPQEMVKAISDKLKLLIASETLRTEMGKKNYLHCRDHYSWNRTKENILGLFDEYETKEMQA